MALFSEKARFWPRINTAGELAALLDNVQPAGDGFTANPPCHSSSRESFDFRDHPDGGIEINCWAPSCQYRGYVDDLEETLGYALQLHLPNGELRYRDSQRRGGSDPKGIAKQKKRPSRPVTRYEDKLLTLRDLYEAQYWFVGDGKKGATWNVKGKPVMQRHSTDRGDVAKARYGVKRHPIVARSARMAKLAPWMTYADVKAGIKRNAELRKKNCRPCFALSANRETPCDHRLVLLDFEYEPGDDPDGVGFNIAHTMKVRALSIGLPVFSSGNGFHVVMRHDLPDGFPLSRIFPDKPEHGCLVHIFVSGDLRLVAWRVDNRLDDGDDDTPLPVMDEDSLEWLLRGAGEKPSDVGRSTSNRTQC